MSEKDYDELVEKVIRASIDNREAEKTLEDALLCGTGLMSDWKRVPPEGIYLTEAEIKLKKVEQGFQELLELTNCMAQMLKEIWAVYVPSRDPSFLVGFNAWKKARGIK